MELELLQGHSPVKAMVLDWCSLLNSSRPSDISSFLPGTGARRLLANNKDSFYELDCHPCNFNLIHPVIIRVEGA